MRGRIPLLVLLCTAQLVDVLDVNAVLVALPVMGRDLGLAPGALQWVFTAYVVVFGGCLLVGGRLADALGRREVFLAGIALFTIASAACALAPGAALLVPARAVQGLGAALTAPAALAMLVAAFPEDALRERAVAVWTGVAAAGGALGLVAGGAIAGGAGWRWIFLVNLPLGAAALLAGPRLLPASARAARAPVPGVDVPGALAGTAGLALLVLALGAAQEDGLLAPVPLAAALGAALLLAGFARRERRSAAPLVPSALVRSPAVVAAAAAAALLTAATSGGGVLASLHLQQVAGLGPGATGLALLPFSAGVVLGSALGSRLRASAPVVIAGGMALVAAGAAVAAAAATTSGRGGVLAWGALTGPGLGAASVAGTTLGSAAAAGADRGAVAGLLSTAAQVGTAIGVAALVLVAGVPGAAAAGHRLGWVCAAALAAAGAVPFALRGVGAGRAPAARSIAASPPAHARRRG